MKAQYTRVLDSTTVCFAGGQILATDAIRAAYHDGRGSIPMRGKVIIEGDTTGNGNGNGSDGTSVVKAGKAGRGKTQRKRSGEGKPAVVITELPYQTNKVRNLKHMHPSQP